MLNDLNRIKSLSGKLSQDEALIENIYIVMKEFGYTLDQVKELPIPTFKFLIKMIQKENKKNKKAMGRVKRGKR